MKKKKREEDEDRWLAPRGYYFGWSWPDELMREMNRVFEEFRPFWRHRIFGPLRRWKEYPSEVKQPPVDVMETPDSIIVTAELPGIEKENVDVHITDDSIEIKGEMKEEKVEEGEDYYKKERSYSSFYRELPLPTEVVSDKATATLNNGVLEVRIPKATPEEKPRKRKVEVK